MLESQHIEWKLIWKDDYLKWLCAFANTNGGLLYIGINDKGKVVGVKNAAELVETIPKKAKDILGIMVEAQVKYKKGTKYVCIKVEEHETPVSCRGKYYLRSGSNTYEAIGTELNRLLLRKSGKSWETSLVHKTSIKDLNPEIINIYKNLALKTGRLTQNAVNIDNEIFLRNLKLYLSGNLTKAALLLFSENPENWLSGSYIKMGLFAPNNTELLKEDEIHGPVFLQIDEALDILYKKYLHLLSKYNRNIESMYIPRVAMKEIITNAVEHKAYDTGLPVLIGVYNNKITVWNAVENLHYINPSIIYNAHASIPSNPVIANALYRCGLTDSWGLGLEKVKNSCIKSNVPLPKYKIDDKGLLVRCNPSKEHLINLRENLKGEQTLRETLLNEIKLDSRVTNEDLQNLLKKVRN